MFKDANLAFWVYILQCSDGRYYTGQTDNLDYRFAQHQAGGYCDFTSRRRPVRLVWSQEFGTRIEALEAEHRIKGWSRAKKEALIRGDWDRIRWLAKPPHERLQKSARPERSAKRVVEGRIAQAEAKRPSTTLRTNEEGWRL